MATIIEQEPLYDILPVGQQVMFSVSNNTIVANQLQVKFVAEVHISQTPINLNTSTDLIATLKTTPNNEGIGIFDLRSMLETFVKPDNEPYRSGIPGSPINAVAEYKGTAASIKTFPIHLVDKFSLSNDTIKFFAVRFLVEYSTTADGTVVPPTEEIDSAIYLMFNGVLQYDEVLDVGNNNYGYDMGDYYLNSCTSSFLTTAPTTQYARLEDYGTLPFLNYMQGTSFLLGSIVISYHYPGGTLTDIIDWSNCFDTSDIEPIRVA